jgi:hypothetical protein
MHIAKNEIPIKENAPGAVARQKPGFGDATGYGEAEETRFIQRESAP